jgi:hypothetical protein
VENRGYAGSLRPGERFLLEPREQFLEILPPAEWVEGGLGAEDVGLR